MESSHENERKPGERLWFEYHCNESLDSPDAPAWLRSHQQCTVLSLNADCDGIGTYSQDERYECGCQLIYRVRFDDGLEWDVFEDELLDSQAEFQRPDPHPNNGTVKNGCFWLDGESWLITDNSKPLNEHLTDTLREQRAYIDRLVKRADRLEAWLSLSQNNAS